MSYLCYGIESLERDKFNTNFKVLPNNKIEGGLWACTYLERDLSEWVMLLPVFMGLCPSLVKDNSTGLVFTIDPTAKCLELSLSNCEGYMKGNLLDLPKIKDYDYIVYTEELVIRNKDFESYYVESIQVLNFNCIKPLCTVPIELTKINMFKMSQRVTRVLNIVKNSQIVKDLKGE